MKMDELNKSILGLLRYDAGMTVETMASKLKVHKNTITARIKKLEEEGVIRSYSYKINYQKLGYKIGVVFFGIVKNSPDMQERLYNDIVSIPQVEAVLVVTGKYNIIGTMWAQDMEEAYEVINKVKTNPCIIDLRFNIITKMHKRFIDFNPFMKKIPQPPKAASKGKMKPLNELDCRILKELEKDSKPLATIARLLNVSPNTIKTRVKKMQKDGVLLNKTANFDIQKLGYVQFWILRLRLGHDADHDAVVKKILAIPQIFDVRSLSGEYDIDVVFLARDNDEYVEVLRKFRAMKEIYQGAMLLTMMSLKKEGMYQPLSRIGNKNLKL